VWVRLRLLVVSQLLTGLMVVWYALGEASKNDLGSLVENVGKNFEPAIGNIKSEISGMAELRKNNTPIISLDKTGAGKPLRERKKN
jgi:hypothetical protein